MYKICSSYALIMHQEKEAKRKLKSHDRNAKLLPDLADIGSSSRQAANTNCDNMSMSHRRAHIV